MILEKKYPLIKEGYDVLDCPWCDEECYPDAKRSNGTIVYTVHFCKPPYELNGNDKHFEIDIDGDIVE